MWQRIKTIFQEADESSLSNPILHDVLKRSSEYKDGFYDWKEKQEDAFFYSWLANIHRKYVEHDQDEKLISFLNTPSKKGFVLHLQHNYLFDDPQYLMDSIKERVLNLGYRVYLSDQKSYNSTNSIETLQRHYLKPPLNFQPNKKLSQLFGNIAIQLVLKNDIPRYLKFSATTYQDRMFDDADTFNNLILQLCR